MGGQTRMLVRSSGMVWKGRADGEFWRRKAQPGPPHAQPAVPADLLAWAGEVDVSRLSDKTFQNAEDFLKRYRYMNLDLSQQLGWRLIAAVEAQVTPSPPADAQPLDVLATVVALRRKQLGIGLSSPSVLACPRWVMSHTTSVSAVGRSLVAVLTSADGALGLVSPPRLPRLNPSHRVLCTSACTNLVDDLLFRRSVCASGQRASAQVSPSRWLPRNDRKYPALTGRLDTRRVVCDRVRHLGPRRPGPRHHVSRGGS